MESRENAGCAVDVSRRSFLKIGMGACLATAASAAVVQPASAFAGERGESRFTEEELAKIGQPHPGTPVSYEPIEGTDDIAPVDAPEQWDAEVDVVVVGLGGGGLVASTMCAEAGLSVIGLDKMPEIGGCTKESSVYMWDFGGSKLHDAIGFAKPVFPYDPEAVVQTWLASDPTLDIPLARKYARYIPDCIDWMYEHGVKWEMMFGQPNALVWEHTLDGMFFPRAMVPVCNQVGSAAEAAGAEFRLSSQVVALVKEGDAVVGVKVVTIDGSEQYFRADKGVILTSGGMEASPALLQKYAPTIYAGSVSTYHPPCNTGETIRMGFGAGADIAGFDTADGFDGGIDAYYEGTRPWSHYLYSGDNQLSRQPWLSISRTGQRHFYAPFMPDGYRTGGVWDIGGGFTTSQAQCHLPGGRAYVIFDDNYEENIFKLKQTGCRTPITPDMQGIERMPEWLAPHDWRDGVAKALEEGAIKRADTFDELAEMLGIDAGVLKKAVEDWNAMCEAGEDPDFFYQPDWLIPITTPPYYGIRIGMQVSKTHAGLRINPNFQVLGKNGLPIKGLFAGTHTNGGTSLFAYGNSGSWSGGYGCAKGLLETME